MCCQRPPLQVPCPPSVLQWFIGCLATLLRQKGVVIGKLLPALLAGRGIESIQ